VNDRHRIWRRTQSLLEYLETTVVRCARCGDDMTYPEIFLDDSDTPYAPGRRVAMICLDCYEARAVLQALGT